MRPRRIIATTILLSGACVAAACGRTELDSVAASIACTHDSDCAAGEHCDLVQSVCAQDVDCTPICSVTPGAARTTCDNGECRVAVCTPGAADCNGEYADGCEIDLVHDPAHCGTCSVACSMAQTCDNGECVLLESAFEPTENPTYLSPGPHHFARVHIPAGITVYVSGIGQRSGQLELFSDGPIVIDGTIDLSGGPGVAGFTYTDGSQTGVAGAGGNTGEPYRSGDLSAACSFVAGNPGQRGMNVLGSEGTCPVISSNQCELAAERQQAFTAPLAQSGGGAGVHTGFRAYGSGGGGPAGGGPGALCVPYANQSDCSGVSAGGGATAGNGGYAGSVIYAGYAGTQGQTPCAALVNYISNACVGGGGGGSIGPNSAADLSASSTFQPGSGGGGGSADYWNRASRSGTSGGGGGGGALRLSSPTLIVINGQLLADGGPGGDAFIGTGLDAGCDPEPGAAGGGGSGGLIYLAAPVINVSNGGIISAVGGAGGNASPNATGGAGGGGGLGRIRFSVNTESCNLSGLFNPPVVSGCVITNQPGASYIGSYPN